MQRNILPQRLLSTADLLILCLIATAIYGVVSVGQQWRADFHPFTQIDLSVWALPKYTLFSAMRGLMAYLLSLAFTLVIGYVAAKSRAAERILIPAIDILQSIPVLGFLPAVTLSLVALFPHTNVGLELACVLTIFTGQVWNMTLSFYSSVKAVPSDLCEAATVMDLNWKQRLFKLELPYSAMNLAWNSLMSMAGGWFFLAVCEAFKLGEQEYRLPGIGSYMQVAVAEGNTKAMWLGVAAMTILIVSMDFVIWRPILAWVHRFRLAEVEGGSAPTDPLMRIMMRDSWIVRFIRVEFRRYLGGRRPAEAAPSVEALPTPSALPRALATRNAALQRALAEFSRRRRSPETIRALEAFFSGLAAGFIIWGAWRLVRLLSGIEFVTWVMVARNTMWTLLRVFCALVISTLWAVPAGIWIGTSRTRVRIAQPIIQVLASFPAPMLYPLVIGVLFKLHVSFDFGSMLLMLLGVQWYVLFNVLAGALRIPMELKYALELMEVSRWEQWKTLYLPSVFPSLVTGWVTAAGGAWNTSIVAEYAAYNGGILQTSGLGSTISVAAERADFKLLAASLVVMVAVVLLLNRTLWSRLYHEAQNRFRMDM